MKGLGGMSSRKGEKMYWRTTIELAVWRWYKKKAVKKKKMISELAEHIVSRYEREVETFIQRCAGIFADKINEVRKLTSETPREEIERFFTNTMKLGMLDAEDRPAPGSARKTDNPVFRQTIDGLTGVSAEFFQSLLYILQDEELALGYLSLFEWSHKMAVAETLTELLGKKFETTTPSGSVFHAVNTTHIQEHIDALGPLDREEKEEVDDAHYQVNLGAIDQSASPIQVTGWYTIDKSSITDPEHIDEYIEKGILRRIQKEKKHE